jgi:hypothetical protein
MGVTHGMSGAGGGDTQLNRGDVSDIPRTCALRWPRSGVRRVVFAARAPGEVKAGILARSVLRCKQ